jgi:ankyrin repeat protein
MSDMTELHSAAYHGELDWVRNCLIGGLDVHARDKHGWTPLHWAVDMAMVEGEREEIARLLLDWGADVNAVDDAGESIIVRAVTAGNHHVVQILLLAGADANALDARGRTLLQKARSNGDRSMVQVLVAALRRAKC